MTFRTLKSIVSLAISFQLSFGSAVALAEAPQPQKPVELKSKPTSVIAQGLMDPELFADLTEALSKAAYPDRPRKSEGPLTTDDIQLLMDRWLNLRQNYIEALTVRALEIPLKTETIDGKQVTTSSQSLWYRQIKVIMEMAQMLVLIKNYAGAPVDPGSFKQFEMRLPLNRFTMIDILHDFSLEQQRLDQTPYGLIDARLDFASDSLVISLNPKRAIVHQLQLLSLLSSSENAKNYLEFLTYQGLYQNLGKIYQLNGQSPSQLPEPSTNLKGRFPVARFFKELAARDENIYLWKEQFNVLQDVLAKIVQSLKEANISFLTPELLKTFAPTIAKLDDKAFGDIFKEKVADEISSEMDNAADFLYLNSQPQPKNLAAWVTRIGKSLIEYQSIATRFAWVSVRSMDSNSREYLIDQIEKRRSEMMSRQDLYKVIEENLKPYLAQLNRETILKKQRVELNTDLVDKVRGFEKPSEDIDAGAWIDVNLNAIAKIEPGAIVQQALAQIKQETTFEQAEIKFEIAFIAFLSTFKTKDLTELLAKKPLPLKEIAEATKDAEWKATLTNESPDSNPEKAKDLSTQRKKDLAKFIEMGQILKFDLPRQTKLKDLALTPEQLAMYRRITTQRSVVNYPILTTQIGRQFRDGKILADKLHDNLDNPAATDFYIAESMAELEKNIQTGLNYVESSVQPISTLTKWSKNVARWSGISTSDDSYDDVAPELLFMFKNSSLLAGNLGTQPAIAASFLSSQLQDHVDTDFKTMRRFLNDSQNYIAYAVMFYAVVSLLSGRVKFARQIMKGLNDLFQPMFGTGLKYLNRGILGYFVADMSSRLFTVYEENHNYNVLQEYYHTLVKIDGKAESLKGRQVDLSTEVSCVIVGTCFVNTYDIFKQKIALGKAEEDFITGFFFVFLLLAGWGVLKGSSIIGNRISKSLSAGLSLDFEVLGLKNPAQWTFNADQLRVQMEAVISRLHGAAERGSVGQEILPRVVEQSYVRLRMAANEESIRWAQLTERYSDAIRDLQLNPKSWPDMEKLGDQLFHIRTSKTLSFKEQYHLRRQGKILLDVLKNEQKRARSPIRFKLREEALERLGVSADTLAEEAAHLKLLKNDQMHIGNYINTSVGPVSSSELPQPLSKLIDRMRDEGIVSADASEEVLMARSRIYQNYVRALMAEAP